MCRLISKWEMSIKCTLVKVYIGVCAKIVKKLQLAYRISFWMNEKKMVECGFYRRKRANERQSLRSAN